MPAIRDPGLNPDDNERHAEEDVLDIEDSEIHAGALGVHGRTESKRNFLAGLSHESIAARMARILDNMANNEDMDVATFLHYMSWNLDLAVVFDNFRWFY